MFVGGVGWVGGGAKNQAPDSVGGELKQGRRKRHYTQANSSLIRGGLLPSPRRIKRIIKG